MLYGTPFLHIHEQFLTLAFLKISIRQDNNIYVGF